MALKNLMGSVTSEDAIIMLRRLCDLLESNSIVDAAGRQRVAIDNSITLTTSISGTPSVTGTVAVSTTAGVDHRQFMDQARTAYNTGIRSQLFFS